MKRFLMKCLVQCIKKTLLPAIASVSPCLCPDPAICNAQGDTLYEHPPKTSSNSRRVFLCLAYCTAGPCLVKQSSFPELSTKDNSSHAALAQE